LCTQSKFTNYESNGIYEAVILDFRNSYFFIKKGVQMDQLLKDKLEILKKVKK
jgi:hypothetical protein